MKVALALLAVATGALAQEAEIRRAVLERDQRTLEFAARLNGAPPAVLRDLENLFARQQLQVLTNPSTATRPDERQAAAREADGYLLRLPPPVVRAKALDDLRLLIESKRCPPVTPPGTSRADCGERP